jgi:hypothetical protein
LLERFWIPEKLEATASLPNPGIERIPGCHFGLFLVSLQTESLAVWKEDFLMPMV